MKHIAIVGAGIAGIYSALLCKTIRPDCRVSLIEQSHQLGGLLASKRFGDYEFDFGTHVPRLTGHEDIDNLLFANMDEQHWHRFQNINAGNVSIDGQYYAQSGNPYLVSKDQQKQRQNLTELLHVAQQNDDTQVEYAHLEEQLLSLYGKGFVDDFFAPCIQRKLSTTLADLAPNTHKLIGLARIIVDDAQAMRALKKQPHLDQILAFADQTEGMSTLTNFYPKHGKGIGLWIENLQQQLLTLGVDIMTTCSVSEIKHRNKHVHSIKLSNGRCMEVDHLFWCSPSFALLNAAKIPFESQYRPQIRQTKLHHFVFARQTLIRNNYVDINDPNYAAFRVTSYANLSASDAVHKLTVEVIEPQQADNSASNEQILNELIDMGLVQADNRVIFRAEDTVKAGFPIMTPAFHVEVQRQQQILNAALNNVTCVGKAKGNSFFMRDVLIDAHDDVMQLLSDANHCASVA